MEIKNFQEENVTVLPPKKICDICGAEIEGNANFCGNCGCLVKDFTDDVFDNIYKTEPQNIPVKKPKKISKTPEQKIIQQTTPQKNFQQHVKNNVAPANEIKCPRCGSKNFKSCQMIYNSGTRTRSFSSSTGYNSYGTNSSLLAQNCAPPFKKKTYWLYIGICFVIFNILSANLISNVAFVVGGVFAVKTLYSFIWNTFTYPKLYSDWLNTFVCSKCGTFFK